jgi:hypothetical protein
MNTTCKNSGTQSKTPKLRFHKMDKGDEIWTKGIRNLFNKIIAEKFQNICNNIDTHV